MWVRFVTALVLVVRSGALTTVNLVELCGVELVGSELSTGVVFCATTVAWLAITVPLASGFATTASKVSTSGAPLTGIDAAGDQVMIPLAKTPPLGIGCTGVSRASIGSVTTTWVASAVPALGMVMV